MNRPQLEFAISQYLDGTLPPPQRAALEQQLATDAEARALLEEYRRLDDVIAVAAPAVPDVNWQRLSQRLCNAVAATTPPHAASYRLSACLNVPRLAAAAVVLLALGLATFVVLHGHRGGTTPTTILAAKPAPITRVSVLNVAAATGAAGAPALPQVQVGPSPVLAQQGINTFDDAVVYRPSRIQVAGAGSAAADESPAPAPH
jgi:anti-sigma-K factor RskA